MSPLFRIGTRGSALALAQARQIQSLLESKAPTLRTRLVIIKTIGDFDLPISQKDPQKYGSGENEIVFFTNGSRQAAMKQLQRMMDKAVIKMEYERALELKEQIRKLKSELA